MSELNFPPAECPDCGCRHAPPQSEWESGGRTIRIHLCRHCFRLFRLKSIGPGLISRCVEFVRSAVVGTVESSETKQAHPISRGGRRSGAGRPVRWWNWRR